MSFDRQKLAHRAMHASISARQRAGLDLYSPICVYNAAEALGVTVRFVGIASMEGMYQQGKTPRIHVSALRPLPRKAFTCGHELGHFVFGHGSTIDELRQEGGKPSDSPNEFLADAFSAFLLMPTLGLRRAFASRGWHVNTATPFQIFVVACEFGVGYSTLVTHLTYGLREMRAGHAADLLRVAPRQLRAEILGESSAAPLIVADEKSAMRTLDVEIGTRILLTAPSAIDGNCVVLERNFEHGALFRAVSSGVVRASSVNSNWATFIRVAKSQYVGLAKYRHLEDADD